MELLYRECYGLVYQISYRYLMVKEDAEDNTVNTFVHLFPNLKQFDSAKGNFTIWLKKVCINQCLMYLRKHRKYRIESEIEHYRESMAVESETEGSMDLKQIIRFIDSLRSPHREVVKLFCIEDFSHREISEILGISDKYSRICLTEARKWLRGMMVKSSITTE